MICFLRGVYIGYTDTEPTSPSSRGPALSVNSHFDNRTCALVHHLTPTRYIKADEIGAVLNYFRVRPESVLVPTPQLVIATKIEELVSDEMVVHTYQAVPIFAKFVVLDRTLRRHRCQCSRAIIHQAAGYQGGKRMLD